MSILNKSQKLIIPYNLYNKNYSTWSYLPSSSPRSAEMSEEKVGASVAPNLTVGAPVRGTAGGEQIVPQRAITSTGTSLIKKQNITFKGQTIKMGQKNLQSILPNTHIKTIAPYGQYQGSTLGLRLSQFALNNLYLTQIQKDIIIGIMLGDCHIKKMSKNGAPMIQYNQGFVHLPYILFLFQFLAPLCTHYPSLIQRKDGTFYLQFYSRCLSTLNPVYDLFVKEGVKTIPNNIADNLSAQSLAFGVWMTVVFRKVGFILIPTLHI